MYRKPRRYLNCAQLIKRAVISGGCAFFKKILIREIYFNTIAIKS